MLSGTDLPTRISAEYDSGFFYDIAKSITAAKRVAVMRMYPNAPALSPDAFFLPVPMAGFKPEFSIPPVFPVPFGVPPFFLSNLFTFAISVIFH